MKNRRTSQIVILCVLVLGCCYGPAQLPADQPEAKYRNVRTGESLEAIRANALQTMDFGLEIMGDVTKMNSSREDLVIFRWEETRDKYLSLWRNTWDWFETSMKEKKMDLAKHLAWRKNYDAFLDAAVSDGEALVYWKWREEILRVNLDYDIRDIPKEITELKNTVSEANTLLTEAKSISGKAGVTPSEIDQAMDKVDMAENLVEKVAQSIEKKQEFVKKERNKKKTSLDSSITQIRDRLKGCPANHPDVMNRYTQRVAAWAEQVDTYWEHYNKSWTKWEDVVKVIMADDMFRDYSFFKDVKYADLTKVTERTRQSLKAMR